MITSYLILCEGIQNRHHFSEVLSQDIISFHFVIEESAIRCIYTRHKTYLAQRPQELYISEYFNIIKI